MMVVVEDREAEELSREISPAHEPPWACFIAACDGPLSDGRGTAGVCDEEGYPSACLKCERSVAADRRETSLRSKGPAQAEASRWRSFQNRGLPELAIDHQDLKPLSLSLLSSPFPFSPPLPSPSPLLKTLPPCPSTPRPPPGTSSRPTSPIRSPLRARPTSPRRAGRRRRPSPRSSTPPRRPPPSSKTASTPSPGLSARTSLLLPGQFTRPSVRLLDGRPAVSLPEPLLKRRPSF